MTWLIRMLSRIDPSDQTLDRITAAAMIYGVIVLAAIVYMYLRMEAMR